LVYYIIITTLLQEDTHLTTYHVWNWNLPQGPQLKEHIEQST